MYHTVCNYSVCSVLNRVVFLLSEGVLVLETRLPVVGQVVFDPLTLAHWRRTKLSSLWLYQLFEKMKNKDKYMRAYELCLSFGLLQLSQTTTEERDGKREICTTQCITSTLQQKTQCVAL